MERKDRLASCQFSENVNNRNKITFQHIIQMIETWAYYVHHIKKWMCNRVLYNWCYFFYLTKWFKSVTTQHIPKQRPNKREVRKTHTVLIEKLKKNTIELNNSEIKSWSKKLMSVQVYTHTHAQRLNIVPFLFYIGTAKLYPISYWELLFLTQIFYCTSIN